VDEEDYGRQPRVLDGTCLLCLFFPICFLFSSYFFSLPPSILFRFFMLFLTFFGSVKFFSRSRTSNSVYRTLPQLSFGTLGQAPQEAEQQ